MYISMNKVLSAIALVLLIACNSSDDDWQREDEYDFDYNVSLASSAWMDVHIINATGSLNNRIFDGLDTYYSCISTEPKIVSSENNDDANVMRRNPAQDLASGERKGLTIAAVRFLP